MSGVAKSATVRQHFAREDASCGRESVSIYRRNTPTGGFAYMVANYSAGKRRFDCYPTEAEAIAAGNLAKLLSERDVISDSMTREQSIEYASAVQTLAPFNVTLSGVTGTVSEFLKIVGTFSSWKPFAFMRPVTRKRQPRGWRMLLPSC